MRNFMTFLVTGWTGFYVMALELLGGRILFPYFGGTINIWGGLICVFLLALSLGYLTGGSLSRLTPTIRMLGFFLFAAAAATIIVYAQGDAVLYGVFQRIMDPRYASLVAALLLFALPAYVLGMVSPYAMRLMASNPKTSGSTAGWLYFTGAVGSAMGTIMTSFYLVLWLDVPSILLVLMGVSSFIGLCTFFVASGDDGY
jgi:hypothetical protein